LFAHGHTPRIQWRVHLYTSKSRKCRIGFAALPLRRIAVSSFLSLLFSLSRRPRRSPLAGSCTSNLLGATLNFDSASIQKFALATTQFAFFKTF